MDRDENKLTEYIDKVFYEHRHFIIIGLTGRTGAGCTTTADLLTSKSFEDLKAPIPKANDYIGKDDRSYKFVYDYLKKHWIRFYKITVSSVILTFILEYTFEEFCSFIKKEYSEFDDSIFSGLQSDFVSLSEKRLEYKEIINKNHGHVPDDEKMIASLETFYFHDIDDFHKRIKSCLSEYDKNAYTVIWQTIGNNIRAVGHPYQTGKDFSYDADELFKLPQRINLYIKILRAKSKNDKSDIRIVIDAFRNPFEVDFFRERYASFYLLSVTAPQSIRRQRLIEKGMDWEGIHSLDKKEDGESKTEKYFISQDVQHCINVSDIFLHNESVVNFSELAKQLVRYVALMLHPGLIAPSKEERCMQTAFNMAANSGCISRKVGAVVTNEKYSILSVGWNDAPAGQVPCNLRSVADLIRNNDITAFSEYELSCSNFRNCIEKKLIKKIDELKENNVSFCFKDAYQGFSGKENQVHTRALHAEENAFLQLVINGVRLENGGILFTSSSPCELCSKKAYQLGIYKIYFIEQYPGISESHILNSGDKRPEMVFYQGAVGNGYIRLYQNSIPLKDEFEMKYKLGLKEKRKD